jgi:predicted negative regulator of RcsB-dependent stress response
MLRRRFTQSITQLRLKSTTRFVLTTQHRFQYSTEAIVDKLTQETNKLMDLVDTETPYKEQLDTVDSLFHEVSNTTDYFKSNPFDQFKHDITIKYLKLMQLDRDILMSSPEVIYQQSEDVLNMEQQQVEQFPEQFLMFQSMYIRAGNRKAHALEHMGQFRLAMIMMANTIARVVALLGTGESEYENTLKSILDIREQMVLRFQSIAKMSMTKPEAFPENSIPTILYELMWSFMIAEKYVPHTTDVIKSIIELNDPAIKLSIIQSVITVATTGLQSGKLSEETFQEFLDTLIANHPSIREFSLIKAHGLLEKGNVAGATPILESLIKNGVSDETTDLAYAYLAKTNAQSGNIEAANKYLSSLDPLYSKHPSAIDRAADALNAMKRYEEAIFSYNELKKVTKDPRQTALLNFKLAYTYLRIGEFDKAIERAKESEAVLNKFQELETLMEMAERKHIPTDEEARQISH